MSDLFSNTCSFLFSLNEARTTNASSRTRTSIPFSTNDPCRFPSLSALTYLLHIFGYLNSSIYLLARSLTRYSHIRTLASPFVFVFVFASPFTSLVVVRIPLSSPLHPFAFHLLLLLIPLFTPPRLQLALALSLFAPIASLFSFVLLARSSHVTLPAFALLCTLIPSLLSTGMPLSISDIFFSAPLSLSRSATESNSRAPGSTRSCDAHRRLLKLSSSHQTVYLCM